MPETDDFFAEATVKNAPRHFPNAFRVIAGVTVGVFIGGGIWGAAQVADALSFNDTTNITPALLQQAEASYYGQHQKFTNDLSQLGNVDSQLPNGVSATVVGVCDDGWLAKVSGALGTNVRYVSGFANSDRASTATSLSNAKLPSCVTPESLNKSGVTIKLSENAVKVSGVEIRRSKTVGDEYAGVHEGIHVQWKSSASCMAGMKPQYQVTVQQQQPAGLDASSAADNFNLRTFSSTKTALSIDAISNGSTYAVSVYGTCTGSFTGVAPVTASYLQPLPPARIRVLYDTQANAGGGVFPLPSASSSNLVAYDIQYRRSYSTGWTMLITSYVSGGPVRTGGYAANYGDQFRARAVSIDGKQVGDWGPATQLRYTSY